MKRRSIIGALRVCLACAVLVVILGDVGLLAKINRNSDAGNTECSDSKVVFEGIDVAVEESRKEVAQKINNSDEDSHPSIWIEMESDFVGLDRPSDDVSEEEAKATLKEQRRLLKEYHTKNNQKMAEELNLDDMNITYSCDSYAPYICAEFKGDMTEKDLDKVYDISKDKAVKRVYVKGKQKTSTELTDSIKAIGADAIINADKNAGSGVVVGILEAKGVVNVNNPALKDANIKIHNQLLYTEQVSAHANQMAIIVHSVAPGASILSSETFGYTLTEEIGWMLDNDANVINMSFSLGDASTNGNYGSDSAYCDYVSRFSWVTFVGSAGNQVDGNIYITQPNGYNTVTVGACYGTYGMENRICDFSSYQENYNIELPNIVAVGIGYSIPTYTGTSGGTSQAAALTSGSIAVLMQKNPTLMKHPEAVLSILMASAEKSSGCATQSGLHEKAGAGALNLGNAVASAGNTVRFTRSSDSVGSHISSKSVYLKAGQTIRVAFASLVNSRGYTTTGIVTDYDLYLFNNSGAQVAVSAGTHNCEFIEYSVPTTGYYTIRIKQYSAKKTNYTDYCSYTYFVK